MVRGNNALSGKQRGLSEEITYNIGASQRSPLCALLCIVYSDAVMGFCRSIPKENIKLDNVWIRNQLAEENGPNLEHEEKQ